MGNKIYFARREEGKKRPSQAERAGTGTTRVTQTPESITNESDPNIRK